MIAIDMVLGEAVFQLTEGLMATLLMCIVFVAAAISQASAGDDVFDRRETVSYKGNAYYTFEVNELAWATGDEYDESFVKKMRGRLDRQRVVTIGISSSNLLIAAQQSGEMKPDQRVSITLIELTAGFPTSLVWINLSAQQISDYIAYSRGKCDSYWTSCEVAIFGWMEFGTMGYRDSYILMVEHMVFSGKHWNNFWDGLGRYFQMDYFGASKTIKFRLRESFGIG